MGRITAVLLLVTYVFLSSTAAAYLYRGGADWGACVAVFVAALGLCLTLHSWVARVRVEGRLRKDVDNLRQANRLFADAMEVSQTHLTDLSEQIQAQSIARTDEISTDVRLLETMVQKLNQDLETKLSAIKNAPMPLHGDRDAPNARRRAAMMLEVVREALMEGRIDLYLQPIVGLPQRKTRHYESFSRLRDERGQTLMPRDYLAIAEEEGLLPGIDNLLLFRCVQIVRRLASQERRVGIFCNISMHSLSDEIFFPRFLQFLAKNQDLSDSVIFEIGQDAFEQRDGLQARHMARLVDLGFRFSIDKVHALDLDLSMLKRSGVHFLKVSAQLLMEQLLDLEGGAGLPQMRDVHPGDFAPLFRKYGIEVIAEKVETERQVVDVLELDIAYGQGHLFGEPRPIKDQVLAETIPPSEFIRPALERNRPFLRAV